MSAPSTQVPHGRMSLVTRTVLLVSAIATIAAIVAGLALLGAHGVH